MANTYVKKILCILGLSSYRRGTYNSDLDVYPRHLSSVTATETNEACSVTASVEKGKPYQIAILGSGNVGGALAERWASQGHTIFLGVLDLIGFKGRYLLKNKNTYLLPVRQAAAKAEVILIATPPTAIFEILEKIGTLNGKIIIDATNVVHHAPRPYPTVYHCLSLGTKARVVKCFNTTGYENLKDPVYDGEGIDMFMAGDCKEAKAVAARLALDAGFSSCVDFGGSDKVELLEKLALAWFNLAYVQGGDKDIAFKLVHRQKSRGNLASRERRGTCRFF